MFFYRRMLGFIVVCRKTRLKRLTSEDASCGVRVVPWVLDGWWRQVRALGEEVWGWDGGIEEKRSASHCVKCLESLNFVGHSYVPLTFNVL